MYTSSKDKNISFEFSCNEAKRFQRDALKNVCKKDMRSVLKNIQISCMNTIIY